MKTIRTFLLTIAVTVAALSATAQGINYQDSEILAQAFLLHDTDHYVAQLYGYSTVNNQQQWMDISVIMDQNLFVTNMNVNGTNIPLPKAIGGIPVPDSGYQNVSVYVYAYDKYGDVASTGQFSTNYLAQDGLISATMIPQFPPTAIQLPTGLDQNSINVALTGTSGWGWSYDPSTGLLTIEVFDNSTTVGYTVTDGSGGLLAHGTLPFFQATPGVGTGTNSVFNLQNAGAVVNLPIGTNGYNYANNIKFDSWVQRNGSYIPAKVVDVPDVANQSKLYIFVAAQNWNGSSVNVEVRKWVPTGTMPLIPSTTTTDEYGDTTVITSQYLDKAVITIMPSGTNTTNSPEVYVSRTY